MKKIYLKSGFVLVDETTGLPLSWSLSMWQDDFERDCLLIKQQVPNFKIPDKPDNYRDWRRYRARFK